MDNSQFPTRRIGHEKEIFNKTYVYGCPNGREYLLRAYRTCGEFLKLGTYKYHCMLETSKTKHVEFCAIPRFLFGYCAEYNEVTNKIQFDEKRQCRHRHRQSFFYSSDTFFCDDCLKLQETSTFFEETTEAMEQSSTDVVVLETSASNCTDATEYIHMALETCAELRGKYEYHCMRVSDKKSLIKLCAKTEVLSGITDYCPEYNPVTKKIQIDKETPCGRKSSQRSYNSSDIVLCDQARCHNLIGTRIRPEASNIMTYILVFALIIFLGGAIVWAVNLIYKKLTHHRRNANSRPANLLQERDEDQLTRSSVV